MPANDVTTDFRSVYQIKHGITRGVGLPYVYVMFDEDADSGDMAARACMLVARKWVTTNYDRTYVNYAHTGLLWYYLQPPSAQARKAALAATPGAASDQLVAALTPGRRSVCLLYESQAQRWTATHNVTPMAWLVVGAQMIRTNDTRAVIAYFMGCVGAYDAAYTGAPLLHTGAHPCPTARPLTEPARVVHADSLSQDLMSCLTGVYFDTDGDDGLVHMADDADAADEQLPSHTTQEELTDASHAYVLDGRRQPALATRRFALDALRACARDRLQAGLTGSRDMEAALDPDQHDVHALVLHTCIAACAAAQPVATAALLAAERAVLAAVVRTLTAAESTPGGAAAAAQFCAVNNLGAVGDALARFDADAAALCAHYTAAAASSADTPSPNPVMTGLLADLAGHAAELVAAGQ